jgi:hypothetical protein
MLSAQLIYIVGDLHADWISVNTYIDNKIRNSKRVAEYKKQYDELEILILQAGDFGYWPHRHTVALDNRIDGIKDGHIKMYWRDGNHENHDALDVLEIKHQGGSFAEAHTENGWNSCRLS